jgi:hypothetical protein
MVLCVLIRTLYDGGRTARVSAGLRPFRCQHDVLTCVVLYITSAGVTVRGPEVHLTRLYTRWDAIRKKGDFSILYRFGHTTRVLRT